ncbi:sirohydrochlorin chelatase [Lysinibacillus telephonicus]|uniref:Sirohydrochlorin chelatase n=1 Tax=Lysinibacillus telephonicus TaxID=1714840 RepID=A0A431UHA6_9BACI|nr:sirohydrochlorin chelatase [Lysinibacillus telephonicus]RTQ89012.1 sirohydrochlorin chelatase [Lysinibacillus telephonicus]
MEAVLYICHGSRIKSAVSQAIEFVESCKSLRNEPIQQYCFLELSQPTIAQALEKCVALGATQIRAIPVLLLTAAHAKIDIPLELEKAMQYYPQVKLQLGKPIGVNNELTNLLYERIQQTYQPITANSKILLVGRGSSDLDVKRDLSLIGKLLEQKINHPVHICFLTGCKPYFRELIAELNDSEIDRIFIVPYFLFTGLLINGIRKTVKEYSQKNNTKYVLCDYLGNASVVVHALNNRINEISFNKVLS